MHPDYVVRSTGGTNLNVIVTYSPEEVGVSKGYIRQSAFLREITSGTTWIDAWPNTEENRSTS